MMSNQQSSIFTAAAARVGARRTAILGALLLCACGSGEHEAVETAEELYEAHSNNLEAAAEAAPPAVAERLRRKAEIQERRSEILEETEGEVKVEPVVREGAGKGEGIADVDWRVEKPAASSDNTGGARAN